MPDRLTSPTSLPVTSSTRRVEHPVEIAEALLQLGVAMIRFVDDMNARLDRMQE